MIQASKTDKAPALGITKPVAIAALFAGALLAVPAAAADCSNHCDYWHNYGPYDFSYISPGLVGYPRCDRQGNCSPNLIYVSPYPARWQKRITVRPVKRPLSTDTPR
jgi:hypothetical protein